MTMPTMADFSYDLFKQSIAVVNEIRRRNFVAPFDITKPTVHQE